MATMMQMPPAPVRPPRPRSTGGLVGQLNTRTLRGQFSLLAVLAVAGAVLALVAALFALSRATDRYTGVVQNTAPGLIAAQQMAQAVADIDARAAEYQLTARIDVTVPDYYVNQTNKSDAYSLRRDAWAAIQTLRADFNRALFAARTNAHTADENTALDVVTGRFYDYIGGLQLMKDALDQGHKEAALAAYADATNLLRGPDAEVQLKSGNWANLDPHAAYTGIEANIQKVARINSDTLADARSNAGGNFGLERVLLVIGLIALVGSVVLAAVRYAIVTHRVIHPPLALAVVGALVVAYLLFSGQSNAERDFTAMARDDFSAINAAANVRQVGADANADESRLLLSPASSGLNSESALITDPIRAEFAQQTLTDSFNGKVSQIKGSLSQIALPDQPGQDNSAQSSLADFLVQDATLRGQFQNQFLAGAIQTYILKANPAFTTFDTSVAATAQANETTFDSRGCQAVGESAFGRVICGGTGYLGSLTLLAWIAIPVIALLVVGGIWLRLREF